MKLVGILPTISNDYNLIEKFVQQIFEQSVSPNLLVIVFQGTEDEQQQFLNNIKVDKSVQIITTIDRSLARSKNLALEFLFEYDFEYCFVYEDDVEYEINYNKKMIDILENEDASMISGVQLIDSNFKTKIRSLIYFFSHLYPINDIRCIIENFNFNTNGVYNTKFLYGGLSMYTKEIATKFRYDQNLVKYSLGEDADFSFRVSQKYKTILTNKVKGLNTSDGTKKFGYENYFKSKISMWKYFIRRNLNNNTSSIVSFTILLLFMFLESIVLSLVLKEFKIMKYFIKDFISVIIKNEHSDFIKEEKII